MTSSTAGISVRGPILMKAVVVTTMLGRKDLCIKSSHM